LTPSVIVTFFSAGKPKGLIVKVIVFVFGFIVYKNGCMMDPIVKDVIKFKFFPLIVNRSPKTNTLGDKLVRTGDAKKRILVTVFGPSLKTIVGFLTDTTGTTTLIVDAGVKVHEIPPIVMEVIVDNFIPVTVIVSPM